MKTLRSMTGGLARLSTITNAASDTTETIVSARMRRDPNQSYRCPLSRTSWSDPTPTASRKRPA